MINKSEFFFKKKLTLFIFICSCLHYFYFNERLQLHMIDCRRIKDYAPSDDMWLSFNNYNKKERFPFIADLEYIPEKTDNDQKASSRSYQHHQVFSIRYYIRCLYDNSLYRFQNIDFDAIRLRFMVRRKTEKFSTLRKKILATNVPMEILSNEQWETLSSATHCHI